MKKDAVKPSKEKQGNKFSSNEFDVKSLNDSKQQPIWHLIVLSALTCTVPYILYWSYKTWRDLKIEANKYAEDNSSPLSMFRKTNPLLRALGLLVPILNIYLLAVLVCGIANIAPDPDSFPRRRPLVSCFLVVGGFLGFLSLSKLPGALYFLSFLCAVPLAFAQHWLNDYWKATEEPGLFIRHAFSVWEMLTIIVGAGLIGLVVTGQMIGVPMH